MVSPNPFRPRPPRRGRVFLLRWTNIASITAHLILISAVAAGVPLVSTGLAGLLGLALLCDLWLYAMLAGRR